MVLSQCKMVCKSSPTKMLSGNYMYIINISFILLQLKSYLHLNSFTPLDTSTEHVCEQSTPGSMDRYSISKPMTCVY